MTNFSRTNLDKTAQAIAYYNYMTSPGVSLYMGFYEGSTYASEPVADALVTPTTMTLPDITALQFFKKIDKSGDGIIALVTPDTTGVISYFGTSYSTVAVADAYANNVNLVYIRVNVPSGDITYASNVRGQCLVLNPYTVGPPSVLATADKYYASAIDLTVGQLLYVNNINTYSRTAAGGEFVELILPF